MKGKKGKRVQRDTVLKGRLDRLMALGEIDRTLGVLRALEAQLAAKVTRAKRIKERRKAA